MAIREGRWDCSTCGSTGIYGRHVDCPGCGKPRPLDVRFYLTDDAPVVVDPERLAEARAGADWVCEHCSASNRALLAHCAGCGAPRGSSPSRPVVDGPAERVPAEPSSAEGGRSDGPPSADAGADAAARAGAPPAVPAPGDPASPSGEPGAPGTSPGDAPTSSVPSDAPGDAAPDDTGPVLAAGAPASDQAAPGAAEPPRTPAAAPVRRPWWPLRLAPPRKRDYFLTLPLLFLAYWVAGVQVKYYLDSIRLHPAVVSDKEWSRVVTMERREMVEEAYWELPAPYDSPVVVRTERRVKDTRRVLAGYDTKSREEKRTTQVADGYESVEEEYSEQVQTGTTSYVCGQRDLGNGYFEDVTCTRPVYETHTGTRTSRQPRYRDVESYETVTDRVPVYRDEPVYGTWYVYRVPRWLSADTLLSASKVSEPAWREVPPQDSSSYRLRDKRESIRIQVQNQNGEWIWIDVPPSVWARHRPGQRVAYRKPDYFRYDLLPADSLPACRRWHRGRGRTPPASLGCSPRRGAASP